MVGLIPENGDSSALASVWLFAAAFS